MLANTGTSGRFSITRMTLPMYMLAMIGQTTSGFSVKNRGPGCSP
jgi:hypothetical protein